MNATDEFVVTYRAQNAWSSLVAWDLFLSGTGAGLFFLAILLPAWGLVSAKAGIWSGWLGMMLVACAGLVLLSDLGVRARFLGVLRRPTASWLSRGAWTMLSFGVFGLLTLAPSLPGLGGLPWGPGRPAGLLEGLALLLAFALMSYTGLLLSSWNSIAFWNTPLLPVLFVTSSLFSGTGVVVAIDVAAAGNGRSLVPLAWLLALALAFELLSYLMVMSSGVGAARYSVRLLMSGREALLFIGGVVLIGLVASAVLLAPGRVLAAAPLGLVVAAGIANLIGAFELRLLVLKAGVYHA